MAVTLYGIKNCSTVKKACDWLEQQGIAYHFHDYKRAGLSRELLQSWTQQLGLEALINKRGITWRKLATQAAVDMSPTGLIALMLAHPSVIKRPLLSKGGEYYLGFDAHRYQQLFAP